jgi:hypothetical protein
MLKGFRDFLLKGDLITAAVGLVMALATFALTEPTKARVPSRTTRLSCASHDTPMLMGRKPDI